MKLYVMSGAVNGIDSIDGMYYLIAETGECLKRIARRRT